MKIFIHQVDNRPKYSTTAVSVFCKMTDRLVGGRWSVNFIKPFVKGISKAQKIVVIVVKENFYNTDQYHLPNVDAIAVFL